MIVADTGPIIAFARLGRLDLLRDSVGNLTIPDAVYKELVERGSQRPGAAEVARGDWIRRRAITDHILLDQIPSILHAGEREAIVLAQELNTQLLIDEERGRGIALAQGLSVIRSLRVLADVKQRGTHRTGPAAHRGATHKRLLDRRRCHSLISGRDGRRIAKRNE